MAAIVFYESGEVTEEENLAFSDEELSDCMLEATEEDIEDVLRGVVAVYSAGDLLDDIASNYVHGESSHRAKVLANLEAELQELSPPPLPPSSIWLSL